VESARSGFESQGRPKTLFEPHVFYRNRSGSKRTAAANAGLAYRKWGEKTYPKDSYPRLIFIAIDEMAAAQAGVGKMIWLLILASSKARFLAVRSRRVLLRPASAAASHL
jgi:hypothetical protein